MKAQVLSVTPSLEIRALTHALGKRNQDHRTNSLPATRSAIPKVVSNTRFSGIVGHHDPGIPECPGFQRPRSLKKQLQAPPLRYPLLRTRDAQPLV
jgi:hypothetical protein